ncbi:Ig-like domain-containing protein [Bradyrhizobium septentrionale]|uniref:Ig-like domain-containing protein n=1 Tax=Bradyrhizobium septentrionale TaxID=1404411 RepID=A0ABZ2NN76_9BRAD
MQVDFSGVVTDISGIPPGGFFQFSSDGSFGLCVVDDGGTKAALTLPTADSKNHTIWIQTGDLTHQPLIHFPDAVLRPELSSRTSRVIGSGLICAGVQRFILGYEAQFQYKTFDVESGLIAALDDHQAVQFSEWSAGQIVDGKFEELYSFPPSKAP